MIVYGCMDKEPLIIGIAGRSCSGKSTLARELHEALGKDISILDTHILKNLKRYKVIDKIPVSISRRCYLNIEDRMRGFSKDIKIPIEELDLLFWSKETGFIFK